MHVPVFRKYSLPRQLDLLHTEYLKQLGLRLVIRHMDETSRCSLYYALFRSIGIHEISRIYPTDLEVTLLHMWGTVSSRDHKSTAVLGIVRQLKLSRAEIV